MSAAVWFLFGGFVGADAVITHAWLAARRVKRGRELRWRISGYTGPARPW